MAASGSSSSVAAAAYLSAYVICVCVHMQLHAHEMSRCDMSVARKGKKSWGVKHERRVREGGREGGREIR